MNVKVIPASEMILLPPPAGKCQECAREHDPKLPHDVQSLYYQFKFNMEHGRKATWADAMAHCSEDIKVLWTAELKKLGMEVDQNETSSN